MKTLLGLISLAFLTTAACGGNVAVDTAGAGGSTATGPGTTFITTIVGTTTIGTTTVTGTCAMTCNDALTRGGPAPCGGPALSAYDALVGCGCSSTSYCSISCEANLCLHEAVSPPCAMCTNAYCNGNYQLCTRN
jgi:hypothetical protein